MSDHPEASQSVLRHFEFALWSITSPCLSLPYHILLYLVPSLIFSPYVLTVYTSRKEID